MFVDDPETGRLLDIKKSTPSIGEFTEMIQSYQGAQGKNVNRGVLQWNNEQEKVAFHYMLLGEEAVVWHQRVHIKVNQRITMTPSEDTPLSYVFSYFFHANEPLHISEEYIFKNKSLIFCNDRGGHQFVMPQGYEGHILQIIISDKFLRNYVPASSLQHPYIHKIIEQLHQDQLILPTIPAYLHAELFKIAEHLSLDGKTTSNKLNVLQLIAEFTDIFFREYLQKQPRKGGVQFMPIFKREVKKYFLSRLDQPFCGIDTLSEEFGVSTSTLKRLFQKHYGQTALSCFKTMQIRHARKLLHSGKYTVSDVAYKLGFSSISNFVRAYKGVLHTTPGIDAKKR